MLRLVANNEQPGKPDYADVAETLRLYAAEIEAGQYGEVICAVLVLEKMDRVAILGCGESPTAYEMMGMFEAAKLQAFADHANGEFDE